MANALSPDAPKCWIITGEFGEYSDYRMWIYGAYRSKEAAELEKARLLTHLAHLYQVLAGVGDDFLRQLKTVQEFSESPGGDEKWYEHGVSIGHYAYPFEYTIHELPLKGGS